MPNCISGEKIRRRELAVQKREKASISTCSAEASVSGVKALEGHQEQI